MAKAELMDCEEHGTYVEWPERDNGCPYCKITALERERDEAREAANRATAALTSLIPLDVCRDPTNPELCAESARAYIKAEAHRAGMLEAVNAVERLDPHVETSRLQALEDAAAAIWERIGKAAEGKRDDREGGERVRLRELRRGRETGTQLARILVRTHQAPRGAGGESMTPERLAELRRIANDSDPMFPNLAIRRSELLRLLDHIEELEERLSDANDILLEMGERE